MRSIGFILFTIFLDATGMCLIIPVLPDVLRRFIHDPTLVSLNFGYFIGIYAVMQFFASPILGALSDCYGRKLILLISLLGAALDYIFMAFAPALGLLYVGRVISGFTGASMAVAYSYMADVSDEKTRPMNFSLISAAWGVGFIIGPLIGGTVGSYGLMFPFLVSAAMNFVNFMFGLFVLPESLPKERRRTLAIKQFNPLILIARSFKRPLIFKLMIIYFLLFLAANVHMVNWTLYTQTKFNWTAKEVGFSLTFVGLMIAFVQGFLSKTIILRLGEKNSLTLGILAYCFSFFLFGLAPKSWMMYPIIALFSLSGIAIPALQSLLSRLIASNEQGELQGILVSFASIAAIIAPIIFSFLFILFTEPDGPALFPGAAYEGAAAICLIALIFWWRIFFKDFKLK
ncbi:TPA: TCR/Tet family MFS transporter [Legionella pneumophila]|uniref:TCR/Tet family MFS transporter n=1 Tax=Legionella pneumophila TaxID=446 RepID=A0AAN5KPW8_LEGPN|nr:TCR/Tet family MFS transporter [Legionella pneumophila]HAT1970863.1 TCR/Tet family MFS transporter [Legionella pneumophila]HAT6957707.1 MFS transporter [Legionella pneumophila]HEN4770250.1 TCR/Tet family MFS transporter [Legionella pneumophila]